MQTQSNNLVWLRIVTFLVAALAAASATYWGLKWTSPPAASPAMAAIFATPPLGDPLAVARLLGGGKVDTSPQAEAATVNASSRFKLLGVVADGHQRGYALIAVDGKPAKPFHVGSQIEDGLLLQAVSPRSAALATSKSGPVSVTLELPKLD